MLTRSVGSWTENRFTDRQNSKLAREWRVPSFSHLSNNDMTEVETRSPNPRTLE